MKTWGLYISLADQGRMLEKLQTHSDSSMVSVCVVTDGQRILGLGDLGTGGMGISEGKIILYTVAAGALSWIFGTEITTEYSCRMHMSRYRAALCGWHVDLLSQSNHVWELQACIFKADSSHCHSTAGVDPDVCLPICLDVGTNNKALLQDPTYPGIKETRITGQQYDAFMEEFVDAIMQWQPHVLLQFEDFGNHNAFRYGTCPFASGRTLPIHWNSAQPVPHA